MATAADAQRAKKAPDVPGLDGEDAEVPFVDPGSILWIAAIPLAETLAASPRANCESWRAI